MEWQVTENELTECPDFRIEDIPGEYPKQVRFIRKKSGMAILAENITGFISCARGNRIKVIPKYKKIDPFVMAGTLQQKTILGVDRNPTPSKKEECATDNILRDFVTGLVYLESKSHKIKRQKTRVCLPSIRGHVDWVRTAPELLRGRDHIHTVIKKATSEIPENVLLAIAARKVIGMYHGTKIEENVLRRWACRYVGYECNKNTLLQLVKSIVRASDGGAHSFYRPVLILAELILGIRGLSAEMDFVVQPMLFNTPLLYEEFARTVIQRMMSDAILSCQKGFTPRTYLFSNNMCEMIPDITIYEGSNIVSILDVKYKKPDAKDFYQIYAYMKYAHLSDAYIITPDEMSQTGDCMTLDGCVVHFIRLDDTSTNGLQTFRECVADCLDI